MRQAVIAIFLAFFSTQSIAKTHLPEARDGDIIFHTSRSSQSVAVQRATGAKYSHMGLVIYRQGRPFVFEAVSTVRFTPLARWIERGIEHRFVLKRLRHADTLLTSETLEKIRVTARQFEGRPYDLTFGWSDEKIYCSELVWKIYDRGLGLQIGALQKVRDFNLSDPIVRSKMRERYGNHVPLNESVISPAAMFQSSLLVTVAEQ